jgi:spermidine/putrescine ABC transporter ATP-binding subunit
MNNVHLQSITFSYDDVIAVDHVELTVHEGEFFALLGPSGSGKTTLLRLIAGFLQPQEGDVTVGDRSLVNVPIYRRNIGFVFQKYALFPHMSVAKNVAFGLENQKLAKTEIDRRVAEVLALVELGGMASRRPSELSGGQQQRVALARAIVTEPSVLLLDEPLAALDKKLRTQMQVELRELQQRLGITTIFVTHDQEEAMTLADRIAVMDRGRIAQVGPPRQVYEHPQSLFVCNFVGEANILEGVVERADEDRIVVDVGGEHRVVAEPAGKGENVDGSHSEISVGEPITVAVRPEKVRLHRAPIDAPILLPGQIQHIAYVGTSQNYYVALDSETKTNGLQMIVFEQSGLHVEPPEIGDQIFLTWDAKQTLILEEYLEDAGAK